MVLNPVWDDNIDQGEEWNGHMVVTGSVSDKHLVLGALLEQDDGLDLTGDEFEAVRKRMLKQWKAYTAVPDPAESPTVRTATANTFSSASTTTRATTTCLPSRG